MSGILPDSAAGQLAWRSSENRQAGSPPAETAKMAIFQKAQAPQDLRPEAPCSGLTGVQPHLQWQIPCPRDCGIHSVNVSTRSFTAGSASRAASGARLNRDSRNFRMETVSYSLWSI